MQVESLIPSQVKAHSKEWGFYLAHGVGIRTGMSGEHPPPLQPEGLLLANLILICQQGESLPTGWQASSPANLERNEFLMRIEHMI